MKNNTERSVNNGVQIVKTAIKQNLSLSEAARQSGFGRNYVSDVRIRLNENFIKDNVSRASDSKFANLISRVEKIKKVQRKLDNLKKV